MSTNYDSITVLEGIEGIRSKLSMYIGSTGVSEEGQAPRALVQMAQEVVSNSLDEFVAGYGDHVKVEIINGVTMRVSDHGRGLPKGDNFEDAINALTKSHASGKFGDSAYAAVGVAGTHGIGLKAVNAASKQLTLTVSRKDEAYTLVFEKGAVVSKRNGITDSEWFADGETGTIIEFTGDTGPISSTNNKPVLESNIWPVHEIKQRLEIAAFLNPGITIEFIERNDDADPRITEWSFERGFIDKMIADGAPEKFVIHVDAVTDVAGHSFGVSIAMAPGDGIMKSYANGVPTKDGGYHVEGFRSAIGRAINSYDIKKKLSAQDVLDSIDMMLHIKVPADIVEFEGQTKEKLGTSKARKAVVNVVGHQLVDALFDNETAAKKIVEAAEEAADDRAAMQKAKEQTRKLRSASKKQGLSVSSKLKTCTSRNPAERELMITEGDSASNIGRDTKFQAVMPLRGKIKNAFKTSVADALTNQEISTLISTIGAGVYKDFDADKSQYGKIILCSDADVDGAHIQTLLIGLFFKLCPGLIESGRLYAVVPPLYKATKYVKGQPTVKMIYSESEMLAERPKLEGWEIQRFKGLGEMNPDEAHYALANPKTRRLQQITMADADEARHVLRFLIGDDITGRKKWIADNVIFTTAE